MIERVEVLPGEGTVIRYGEVVAWAAPSASPALISFLAQSARNLAASARGGRQIADHIAGVLGERDPEPRVAFAVVGPDGGGWASLMHGPVQAWDGNRWLAPTPVPGWLRESLDPHPAVTVSYAGSHVPALDPDGMWDFEGGVVRGGGFVLVPGSRGHRGGPAEPGQVESGQVEPGLLEPFPGGHGQSAGATVDPEATGILEVPDPTSVLPASPPTSMLEAVGSGPQPVSPDPAAAAGEALREPSGAPGQPARPPGSIDLARSAEALGASSEPLPVGVGPDRPVAGAAVVAGALCERGHLNRPGMPACVRCGSSLPQDVPYTVTGTRPGLGCLVVDDGSVWRLDCPYLVGSEPSGDPTVSGGMARPLPLTGDGVAPSHADITLKDWDVQVIDRSSANGTWVHEPGAAAWSRLAPYEARTLRPGTHIAFGQRVVTFVTPWVPGDGRAH